MKDVLEPSLDVKEDGGKQWLEDDDSLISLLVHEIKGNKWLEEKGRRGSFQLHWPKEIGAFLEGKDFEGK
jgi:hypothetical protein